MSAYEQTGRGNASTTAPYDWLSALRQHEFWLRRVLLNRVGDRDAVDDLMQEVGLAASRADLRPQEEGKLSAWLYRVAIRQAYLYRRKMGRYRRLVTTAAGHVGSEPDEIQDPLQWLLGREHQQAVRDVIERLNETDREILILKYAENWTYRQLAERLGVTVHTIEHRLLKAKHKLRKLLNEAHLEPV